MLSMLLNPSRQGELFPQLAARWIARARVVIAIATSATLLTLALPPADLGVLAFIALVPLVIVCREARPMKAAAIGFVFGVASSLGIFHWLLEVPSIGAVQMAVLASYVALYPALWCALQPVLLRSPLPWTLTAAAAWAVVETLRSHAGFLALPWANLAHTQHENLALLQLASVTGEAGVAFVVVLVNAALTEFWVTRRTRPLAAVAAVVALLHVGGFVALAKAASGPTLTVAAIQPVIAVGERATPAQRAATWQRLEALTLEAAQARPALIVWPETAIPDPLLADELAQRLADLAQRTGATLVVGAAEVEKFAARTADGTLALRTRETHNAAYLIAPQTPPAEPYRKRRLVPFAEYLPLEGRFDWPAWLVKPALAHLQAGPTVPPRWSLPDGTRIAALICWENLFASLAHAAVGDGARVLVQLPNDAWFGHSAAARQHNLASVLRAVENRVPVVIASNTGPSQVIDARGRVVAALDEMFVAGFAVASVPTGIGPTVFQKTRGAGSAVALLLTAAALCLGRREATPANSQAQSIDSPVSRSRS